MTEVVPISGAAGAHVREVQMVNGKQCRMLAAVTVAVLLGGCGNLLAGGAQVGQALLPISDQQEEAIGAQADQEVRSQYTIDTDPALNAYVNGIGQKLAAASDRSNIPYHFAVVRSTDINAFSLPGGYVYIDTGALAFIQNEAQLAGILGHEIGHVVHHDQVNNLRAQMVADGLATAAIGTDPGLTQAAAKIAVQLIQNGFDRNEEFDADHASVEEMSRVGYDPTQLVDFFQQLSAKEGDASAWVEPLLDHPTDAQRISALDQIIQQEHLSGTIVNTAQYQQGTATLR